MWGWYLGTPSNSRANARDFAWWVLKLLWGVYWYLRMLWNEDKPYRSQMRAELLGMDQSHQVAMTLGEMLTAVEEMFSKQSLLCRFCPPRDDSAPTSSFNEELLFLRSLQVRVSSQTSLLSPLLPWRFFTFETQRRWSMEEQTVVTHQNVNLTMGSRAWREEFKEKTSVWGF